jgi:hypothetical protein
MSTLTFTPPTDAEKIQWGKSDIEYRAEIGGLIYETNQECKPIFVLEPARRILSKAPNQVGYNHLVGVIHEPTEILQINVRTESDWN